MALTEQTLDTRTGTTHHDDKMMNMCGMMKQCCICMPDEDKEK